ncbi:MAG: Lrp/AsnC family transcriptional regulator [Paracoccaceae bacterium]
MTSRKAKRKLDLIDVKILRALKEDGRISNANLSERVGLSTTPCWERVRWLEQNGFITQYTAELDQGLLGYSEVAMIEIVLEKHDVGAVDKMGTELAKIPEVLEVYLTTGDYDYFLKVAVTGTKGYEEFLRKRLYKIPGIRHSKTCFTLKCFKKTHSFVPDHLTV